LKRGQLVSRCTFWVSRYSVVVAEQSISHFLVIVCWRATHHSIQIPSRLCWKVSPRPSSTFLNPLMYVFLLLFSLIFSHLFFCFSPI
jgi:hypothetical protein